MAEIIDSGGGGGKGKHQKKRAKKHSARIDMTPMVDLGFLLLTFFVLTSQFSKPKTMEINMPVIPKDTVNRMKIEDETALTLLLTEKKEKIYYYYGMFKPDASIIKQTDYSKAGMRKVFRDRNKDVIED
jgi:biopolymer transport protein ExbD